MTLDLSELLRRKLAKKRIETSFQLDTFKENGEIIKFIKPLTIRGEVNRIEDVIKLEATISGEAILNCSRCLESFPYDFSLELDEQFSNDKQNEDDDVIFIDSDSIDITEIIKTNIGIALPIKKLCSEECKGLCHTCGVNLNLNSCNCDKEYVDPRMSKLKDLFSTD